MYLMYLKYLAARYNRPVGVFTLFPQKVFTIYQCAKFQTILDFDLIWAYPAVIML